MKIRIPKIVSNSIIYTIFNVLQKAINFFLLPIYTVYLTPDDYGITSILTSATILLTYLLTFSVQAASSRFHYKYSKSEALVKKIWGSNLLFIITNTVFWAVIITVLYRHTLYFLIGDDVPFMPYVLIGILNCCFSPIYMYFQTYLQTTQRAKFYVINNLAFFLTQLILTITLVVGLKRGALGVILAQLVTNLIFATYAVISLGRYITYKFSSKIIKKSLCYSVPLLPHSLSGWLNGMLDRIFINRIVDLASVGLYTVSSQFGLIINMLGIGVNHAFTPWFFKNYSTKEGRKKILVFSDLVLAALCIISFSIALFSQEILTVMTAKQYHSIWMAVGILAFANLYGDFYYFYVAPLFLDKTPVLSAISITCALVNCAVNIILIKMFGYIGAACSYLAVHLVKSFVVRCFSYKYHGEILYHTKKHYSESFIGVALIFAVFTILNEIAILAIVVKVMVLILYITILFLLNKFEIKISYENYVKKNN